MRHARPPPEPPRRRRVDRAVLAGLGLALAATVLQAAHRAAVRTRAPPTPPHAIDLATAEAWELTLLPGIGRSRAHAIVSARTREDGAWFRTWDDVLAVPGIGPGTLRGLQAADLPVRVLLRGRPLRWAGEPRPREPH